MLVRSLLTACAIVAFGATAASSQTVGFATTPPGSFTHSTGSAVAKIIKEYGGLEARVQPSSASPHIQVAARQAELGLANSFDLLFYIKGIEDYAGKPPHPEMRLWAVLTPLRVGIWVRKDSDIHELRDLKGKRVGGGFVMQKTIGRIIEAHLANAGLGWDDVRPVAAPNVVQAADDFAAGKSDIMFFALGSAKVKEVNAKVGGVRLVSVYKTPEAVARMNRILPGSYTLTVPPIKPLLVDKPTTIIAFDFLLNTRADVSDDIIYKSVKALHDHRKELVAAFPGLVLFNPDKMVKSYEGMQWHTGAIKYYKEIGAWPPKM